MIVVHLQGKQAASLTKFQVTGVVCDFEIFDTTNWPLSKADRSQVIQYGQEQIGHILDHYDRLFTGDFRQRAEDEWLRLKMFVCKKLPSCELIKKFFLSLVTTSITGV